MIQTKDFYNTLLDNGIKFFTGVPDSLLADICAYIADNADKNDHIIAANEGNSLGLAVGYHLATKQIPLVYLQNSGLGNLVNPMLSLADDKVYAIPMIILMGWRGEPGISDEPQHIRQGEVTVAMLKSMNMDYEIVDSNTDFVNLINSVTIKSQVTSKPVFLLVRKNTFSPYKLRSRDERFYALSREEALINVINSVDDSDIIVSTTGKTSRELFEHRYRLGQGHERDFLTVGGMGHASSIAVGIALCKQQRSVFCIDGDGALIMHMGCLAIIGSMNTLNNFKHIVINNGAHESVGGQPSAGFNVNFVEIAKSCGYTYANTCDNITDLLKELEVLKGHKGRGLLEIKVNLNSRSNLGRPTKTPVANKEEFMSFINN